MARSTLEIRTGAIRLAPGLTLVVAGTVAATAVNRAAPVVSPLVAAVALGAAYGNLRPRPAAGPGLAFAARRFLRWGVVLLGLRLSFSQIGQLGPKALIVVTTTVAATFFGTQYIGRRLGLSRDLSLLVATGYAICGASAIAAIEGSTDAEETEVAAAIGLVTVAGTLAIFALPSLAAPLGLGSEAFGSWVGASVHDVAQVVAAASVRDDAALSTAIVVKLTRVVLLAPIVVGVNLVRSRGPVANGARPPVLPLFVAGFLVAVALRSTDVLSELSLSGAKAAEGILLTAALVGLGAGVRIDRMRRMGVRPLVLGGLAWALVAGVALVGVRLTG